MSADRVPIIFMRSKRWALPGFSRSPARPVRHHVMAPPAVGKVTSWLDVRCSLGGASRERALTQAIRAALLARATETKRAGRRSSSVFTQAKAGASLPSNAHAKAHAARGAAQFSNCARLDLPVPLHALALVEDFLLVEIHRQVRVADLAEPAARRRPRGRAAEILAAEQRGSRFRSAHGSTTLSMGNPIRKQSEE